MMFDSITKALTFLKQTLQDWGSTKKRLENRLYEISTLIRSYSLPSQLGPSNQEVIGNLIVLKTQTQHSLREYENLTQKLGPFRSYFESNSLSAFPLFIIGSAVGLASALYIYLEKVNNEGKALELIKQGLLKPSEARSLLTGGGLSETLGNVNTMLMLGLGVYVLLMFGPMVKGKSS
jgi:hypothetical protein